MYVSNTSGIKKLDFIDIQGLSCLSSGFDNAKDPDWNIKALTKGMKNQLKKSLRESLRRIRTW